MNETGKNNISLLSSNERHYIIPARLSQHQIVTALSAYTLERLSFTSCLFDIYDTFDGQLAAAHTALVKVENNIYFIDQKSGSYLESSKDLYQQYYHWQDFSGRLRELLKQKADNRALYARLEIQMKRSTMRLVNGDGKTVQICHFIRLIVAAHGKTRTIKLINTIPLKGYTHDLRWVEAQFSAMGMNEKKASIVDFCLYEIETVASFLKFKLALKKNKASWRALQAILQMLYKTMQANREGFLKEIDIEFLHDFRVALRRTRTLLDQLNSILPETEAKHFAAEFKKLQWSTNRLRDLDVYLLHRQVYEDALPTSLRPGLEPFFAILTKNRRDEFNKVHRLFNSAEYDELMQHWTNFLTTDWRRQENLILQNAPIRSLADQLVSDMVDEILKKGAKVTADAPIEQIHKIRIRCKKLRYIVEFFRSLYPADMKKVIVQVKELQDYLGRLNDLSVQQKQIMKFMQKLQPEVDNQTIAALGGLVAVLNRDFESMRAHLRSQLDAFSRNMSKSFRI